LAARGRPTVFKDEYCELANKFCLLGATNADLARMFSVDERTIDRWIAEKPDFCRTIKEGREEADARVAERLYSRAVGYDNPNAVKIFMPAGASAPVYAPYTEHHPPDTTAQIFWLKNRQRDKWRDKHDHEHAGAGGGPLVIKWQPPS
jgi:hypothetical protein